MNLKIKQRIKQIKNSKVPEGYISTKAGVLPKWDCVHISQIAEPITVKVGNSIYETLSISAGVGFVNQAKKFGKELSGKQYEKYTVLKRGDFSYNKGNSKTYPQGCIYRLKDRETAAVPNVFESFTVKEGDSDYYEQLFTLGFLNKQLSTKINHGVRDDGLLNLPGKDFYSCYLPAPPLVEQQKIAEILMQCDKVIELKQKHIDETKKLKKVFLNKMFPKNGENVPEIRFSGFTDPWKQRKLGEFCEITTGRLDANAMVPDGKYDFYTSGIAKYKIDIPAFSGPAITIAGNGATVGYMHLADGLFNAYQRTYVLSDFSADRQYLFYAIGTKLPEKIAQEARTGNIPYIVMDMLTDLDIDMPSVEEQAQIGAYLKNLDNLITLHQRELQEWQNKKKALMQLLLTGIVRVNI